MAWLRRNPAVLAVLFAGITCLSFLGEEEDVDSREARHADVARELAAGGDWLVPTSEGRMYSSKPPLFCWLEATAFLAAGRVSIGLARLPCALAGVAGVLALYGIGAALSSRRAGLLAALLLACAPGYVVMARTTRPDMLMTAGILVAAWGAARGPKTAWAYAAMGGGIGWAVMSKGPIGLLLPLVFHFLLAWTRRTGWKRALVGAAAALGVAAVLVGAWAVAVLQRPGGGDYLWHMVFQHDVYHGGGGSARLWYSYLGWFAMGFAPGLPFLLVGAADREGRTRGGTPAALGVVLATVVLFSFLPSRRAHYLLPGYPFAALAAGEALDRRWERGRALRLAVQAACVVGVAAWPVFYGALVGGLKDRDPMESLIVESRSILPEGAEVGCLGGGAAAVRVLTGHPAVTLEWGIPFADWARGRVPAYVILETSERERLAGESGRPVALVDSVAGTVNSARREIGLYRVDAAP